LSAKGDFGGQNPMEINWNNRGKKGKQIGRDWDFYIPEWDNPGRNQERYAIRGEWGS